LVAGLAPQAKSMMRSRLRTAALVAVAVAGALAALPPTAQAHGPIAPVASSYLARVTSAPAGLDARVVDGDLRMWLSAPPGETVVVLDYRGAPYLRFSRSGVWVNHNSAMYYLNQTPFAERPPARLGPKTPPRWELVSTGHDYNWHDGRLHALAAVALSSGQSYVGKWRVPVLVDGSLSSISGGLWHAADPSIVWFWPIVVLLLCVLAAWRVKNQAVDRWTARLLGLAALAAVAVVAVGRELHGRPTVSVIQLLELAALMAFVAWGLARIGWRRAGHFTYFFIGLVALLEGAELIPTLVSRFVLMAVPAFLARTATVLCLGASIGLFLMVLRIFDQRHDAGREGQSVEGREGGDDSAVELV